MSIRSRFFGDRKFYRRVLAVALPIMIQMGVTNFVSLLDNIMVGRLGTEAMSGVSIVNQFIFVFNLLIFGAMSGAGIFTVQYYGTRDVEGVRHTFRFKFLTGISLTVLSMVVFFLFDEQLISLFLYGGEASGDLVATLAVGKDYLKIMLVGLIPYTLSQLYASTMKETEQTVVPMVASVAAVLTNFVLNLLLIFGMLGLPALGARGAAIATVISRFVELAILVIRGHTCKETSVFLHGVYRSMRIPRTLFFRIVAKGVPLMLNELFWALAITMRNQSYATRGLDVVAAQNICSTILNVFNVFYMAVGNSVAILVGGLLGAGKTEEARDTNRKMLVCSVMCGCLLGGILTVSSGLFPRLYNTDEQVRELAAYMMVLSGLFMPFCSYAYASYFSVRSGGQVGIATLMDSGYMWLIVIPITFIVSRFTPVEIGLLFALGQGSEILKAAFGFVLICRGKWLHCLIDQKKTE